MNDSTAVVDRKEEAVDVKEELKEELEESPVEGAQATEEASEEGPEEQEGEATDLKALLEGKAQEVARLEEQVARLQEEARERDRGMASLRQQFSRAIEKYRESLLASAPEVPAELVQGETVEDLETSLVQGRQLVERIRHQLESKAKKERVPAGAPIRKGPDLTSLSPTEKIVYGLSSQRVSNG